MSTNKSKQKFIFNQIHVYFDVYCSTVSNEEKKY